jgi:hypothetical protein
MTSNPLVYLALVLIIPGAISLVKYGLRFVEAVDQSDRVGQLHWQPRALGSTLVLGLGILLVDLAWGDRVGAAVMACLLLGTSWLLIRSLLAGRRARLSE